MDINAGRLRQGTPAREYLSAEENHAHARAVRARLMGPPPEARPVLAVSAKILIAPSAPVGRPAKRWVLVDEEEAARLAAEAEERRARIEAEREAFKPRVPQPRALVFRPREIMRLIAEHHGITVADLTGRARLARFVTPRQLAMLAIWIECPVQTLPSIGRLFGRDHTTVLFAIRKYGDPAQRRWPAELSALRDLLAVPADATGEGRAP